MEEDYIVEQTPLNIYIREISKIPLLTTEEEKSLVKQIKNGDINAKHKLIKSNLRFVIHEAKKYQNNGLPLEDLINEGNTGLIKAVEKYDSSKNVKFITYADWWIKQSIQRALNNISRFIRLTAHKCGLLNKMNRLKREGFSNEEISEIINKPINDINYLFNISKKPLSFDSDKDNSDGVNKYKYIADPKDYSKSFLDTEREYFISVIDRYLTEKEAEIIKLRFGFLDGNCYTLREIGEIYDLSKERISQIEEKAIKKLRRRPEIKELKECY